MIQHLNSAFDLEIVRVEELMMHFFQSRYVYSMLSLNRKNTVTNYVEDLLK